MSREPVVVAFVAAAVALFAALGIDISGWQETAVDIGSAVFIIWQVIRARSKVTPVA